MERKYSNYIREWRLDRKLSQKELVGRLIELAGGENPDDPELRIPTTEASLSRIENGKQNFNMAALQAIADALEVEEAGWLLDRNPSKKGEVVQLFGPVTPEEKARVSAVLKAMLGEDRVAG